MLEKKVVWHQIAFKVGLCFGMMNVLFDSNTRLWILVNVEINTM